jgi:hypothetical protein
MHTLVRTMTCFDWTVCRMDRLDPAPLKLSGGPGGKARGNAPFAILCMRHLYIIDLSISFIL